MTKRPTKKKTANPAPRRPDPAVRPKAVIDAVAREVGSAKSASAKHQAPPASKPAHGPARPAAKNREKPPTAAGRPSPSTPGRPPNLPFVQLAVAGALGAALVLAVLLALRFGSQTTANWMTAISGANAVERQVAAAQSDIEKLQKELADLRQNSATDNAATSAALATQAQRIDGLDAGLALVAVTRKTLTQNLATAQEKTGQVAAAIATLEGEISKVAREVNRLATARPTIKTTDASEPSANPGAARLAALEASVTALSTDLARLDANAAPGTTDQLAQVSEIATQVSQAKQRVETLEKKLGTVAAKADLAGLSVYYQVVAGRLARGLPFTGALALLETALGVPNPALKAVANGGVMSRGQLIEALKAMMQTPGVTPPPAAQSIDQPPQAAGWIDRLIDRASRSISISKTTNPARGQTAAPTLAQALQSLEKGNLDQAIALAARSPDEPALSAWLADARSLSAAEQALGTLKLQVETAIARRAGEAS